MAPSRGAARFIAAVLSCILFLTNSVFAGLTEANIWKFSRAAHAIAPQLPILPASLGSIRRISTPAHSKPIGTILHIQDVHLNPEAQANIGSAIHRLIERGDVGLVALEGVFTPMDFGPYQRYPRPEVIRKVADFYLKEKEISGAVHAAFVSRGRAPAFIGVDDKQHYDANVQAYRDSIPLAAMEKQRLAGKESGLALRKSAVFNGELKAFDREMEERRKGRVDLAAHARFLSKFAEPSLTTEAFLEAVKAEKTIDFAAVERERKRIIDQLSRRAGRSEFDRLAQASAAFQSGDLRHSDFYDFFQKMCRANGVDLFRFPALNAYVQYVRLSDTIDAEKLLGDLKRSEEEIYVKLARIPEEKQLVEESKRLYLTGKLIKFELTREEWEEYSSPRRKPGPRSLPEGKAWIPAFAGMTALQPFEDFYREAEARDAAMAENLLKLKPQGSVVLVTGGFHSPGIDQRLTAAGYTVVSFVPKVTQMDKDGGSAYLSVFAQQKTPLNKLFEGEKLFVVPQPDARGFPECVAAADRSVKPQEAIFSLSPQSPIRVADETPGNVRKLVFRNIRNGASAELELEDDEQEIKEARWKLRYQRTFAGLESIPFGVGAIGVPFMGLLWSLGAFGAAPHWFVSYLMLILLLIGHQINRDVHLSLHGPEADNPIGRETIYKLRIIYGATFLVTVGIAHVGLPLPESLWLAFGISSAVFVLAHYTNDWLNLAGRTLWGLGRVALSLSGSHESTVRIMEVGDFRDQLNGSQHSLLVEMAGIARRGDPYEIGAFRRSIAGLPRVPVVREIVLKKTDNGKAPVSAGLRAAIEVFLLAPVLDVRSMRRLLVENGAKPEVLALFDHLASGKPAKIDLIQQSLLAAGFNADREDVKTFRILLLRDVFALAHDHQFDEDAGRLVMVLKTVAKVPTRLETPSRFLSGVADRQGRSAPLGVIPWLWSWWLTRALWFLRVPDRAIGVILGLLEDAAFLGVIVGLGTPFLVAHYGLPVQWAFEITMTTAFVLFVLSHAFGTLKLINGQFDRAPPSWENLERIFYLAVKIHLLYASVLSLTIFIAPFVPTGLPLEYLPLAAVMLYHGVYHNGYYAPKHGDPLGVGGFVPGFSLEDVIKNLRSESPDTAVKWLDRMQDTAKITNLDARRARVEMLREELARSSGSGFTTEDIKKAFRALNGGAFGDILLKILEHFPEINPWLIDDAEDVNRHPGSAVVFVTVRGIQSLMEKNGVDPNLLEAYQSFVSRKRVRNDQAKAEALMPFLARVLLGRQVLDETFEVVTRIRKAAGYFGPWYGPRPGERKSNRAVTWGVLLLTFSLLTTATKVFAQPQNAPIVPGPTPSLQARIINARFADTVTDVGVRHIEGGVSKVLQTDLPGKGLTVVLLDGLEETQAEKELRDILNQRPHEPILFVSSNFKNVSQDVMALVHRFVNHQQLSTGDDVFHGGDASGQGILSLAELEALLKKNGFLNSYTKLAFLSSRRLYWIDRSDVQSELIMEALFILLDGAESLVVTGFKGLATLDQEYRLRETQL